MFNNLEKRFKSIYHQLVEIDDTPHRKAFGLGLGVFLGIFPGMGPIVSIVLATFLKVNKAAALLGSVLTNTWLSVVTLTLAVQMGAWFSKSDVQALKENWKIAAANFQWTALKNPSLWKSLGAVASGFFVISFFLGFRVYLMAFLVLTHQHKRHAAKIP